MEFSTTLIFYFVAGVSVAIAVWLTDDAGTVMQRLQRCGKLVAAVAFWPMFLPLLLSSGSDTSHSAVNESQQSVHPEPDDSMTQAVRQVESELEKALESLDEWSGGILSRELGRIEELRLAWRAQAERVRELDRLLSSPGFEDDSSSTEDSGMCDVIRIQSARTTRQENIVRLKELRTRLRTDLMATLAWVRELVTMIHLARFSGAPASRAEELVAQIAAAVEGLSEVNSWSDASETAESSLVAAV